MTNPPLHVLAVVGTLTRESILSAVVNRAAEEWSAAGCAVDVLHLEKEPLALFNPDVTRDQPGYSELQARVDRADVLVLATPDYHGSISGALKNFLDHFWHEFAGKLFVTIVSSHEKGLTVADQLRTVARQCYAWTLPYGVAFSPDEIKNGEIVSKPLQQRLKMMVHDARVYGTLLARQRAADLSGSEPTFLARYRAPAQPQ
jgi:NAD(P)H-dependent FMN reductase